MPLFQVGYEADAFLLVLTFGDELRLRLGRFRLLPFEPFPLELFPLEPFPLESLLFEKPDRFADRVWGALESGRT